MNLIIVESPTKCKTLSRFLGKEYQLESTMGHIRDLPKSKLAVDVKKKFKPDWEIVSGKEKVISQLKKAAKKAKQVILATDLDREGEAIAYHVSVICSNEKLKMKNEKFYRIVFHEITKEAIEKALENPRKIDMNLVRAQKARRILDRLVGYKLSPMLWKKVRRGLSAGRVQSVVVRLITEREAEIKKFSSEEYWRIYASLTIPDRNMPTIRDREIFLAELVGKSGEKYSLGEKVELFSGTHTITKTRIINQKQAEAIVKDLNNSFIVEKIEKKQAFRYPAAPFITSTLQQAAGQRFGWSGKFTMRIAQSLYEKGLITYHRTDSTHLAQSAVQKIREYIKKNFSDEYLPQQAKIYKTKSKVAQEAHEAIRPTNIEVRGQRLGADLKGQAQKLYDFIWQRAIACQMAAARIEKVKLIINCGEYQFESNGQRMLFDGFLNVYQISFSENILPALKKGDRLKLTSLGAIRNTTSPPPRYTEASLIKSLEREGIGRPSTYAQIISLIQQRQYVEKLEAKFHSTNLGEAVNGFLVKNFSDIVDIPFTAQMENDLDGIANGKLKWVNVIDDFYTPLEKKLTQVEKKAERVKIEVEKTDKKCPQCGGDLIIRIGRFGKFIACSNFPECKYTQAFVEIIKGVKCPQCGKAIVIKRSKKGKKFYGCSNYPKCNWASWRRPKS